LHAQAAKASTQIEKFDAERLRPRIVPDAAAQWT
jgi:hypothetical protein